MHSSHRAGVRAAPTTQTATRGLLSLMSGVALTALVFGLGAVATFPAVAGWDLNIDQHIADHDRTRILTSSARVLTAMATPTVVGLGGVIALPVATWLVGRRRQAVRTLLLIGLALALAEVVKALIGEGRPPSSLWAAPADSGNGFPSGHTTVAAVITIAVVCVAQRGPARRTVAALGGLYTAGVGASRVYLANHYLLDIVGSLLTAWAAALLVAGVVALPAIDRRLERLDNRRPPSAGTNRAGPRP